MAFDATARGHVVTIDSRSPVGADGGQSPKELLLASIGGCTAMDVAGILRKARQKPTRIDVRVEADLPSGPHPRVFTRANLTFVVDGEVEVATVVEAVRASQTLYCGVTAMLSRAFPIHYDVIVNGANAASGQADFGSVPTASTSPDGT
jgi:putative redox protein